MTTYAVHRWNDDHECAQSRKVGEMRWFPTPTRLDGDFYVEMMMQPNGVALWGVWCAILIVAAKGSPRGVLVRKTGQPHTPESIAVLTRMPLPIIADAWSHFIGSGLLVEWDPKSHRDGIPDTTPVGSGIPLDRDSESHPSGPFLEEKRTEEKRRGERACARETSGATAPEPPPPLSRISPEEETATAETVIADWNAAAEACGKVPGVAGTKHARAIATVCPNADTRRSAFRAVFTEREPPSMRFVAEDLPKWIVRGLELEKAERRRLADANEARRAIEAERAEEVARENLPPRERARRLREQAKTARRLRLNDKANELERLANELYPDGSGEERRTADEQINAVKGFST